MVWNHQAGSFHFILRFSHRIPPQTSPTVWKWDRGMMSINLAMVALMVYGRSKVDPINWRYRFHICLAYVSGLCKWISPQHMAKHMVRLRTSIHSDPGDLPLTNLSSWYKFKLTSRIIYLFNVALRRSLDPNSLFSMTVEWYPWHRPGSDSEHLSMVHSGAP
jgi:hypothetical protein